MKYVCKICGYIYDDDKQAVPFSQLPDSWLCPLCGAIKADFVPMGEEGKKSPKPDVEVDADMLKLSIGQMAALCSNLARGCEKQYKAEEAELYQKLAGYFAEITPPVEEHEISDIAGLIREDLEEKYPLVNAVAKEHGDRGSQRVCVWGEKVTRILNTLIARYEKEGESFLASTDIWLCTVCGFVYIGDTPPKLCPVCKVPDWKFEKIEGRKQA